MTELTEDKIKVAGGKLFLWRKIYNILCRSCKMKIFRAGTKYKFHQVGTKGVIDEMQKVIDNDLCSFCKNRIDLILEKEEGD